MSRHYHVDIARHAVQADAKWVDNLLSHYAIPGVERARQGVARRVTVHGVYHVALIRRLAMNLRLPVDKAVEIAGQLLATNTRHVRFGGGLEIHLDREAFEREIDDRIADAVESVVAPRRGRPPGRRLDHATSE